MKSKQGTQFRQWATQRLKDYLVKGYAINEKRLKEAENKFQELKQAVSLLESIAKTKDITGDEAQGLLKVLGDYAFALDILDQYNHQTLKIDETDNKEVFHISYAETKKAIEGLKLNLEVLNCLGMKKTILSKVLWKLFIKLLMVSNCIHLSKKKLPIFCVL